MTSPPAGAASAGGEAGRDGACGPGAADPVCRRFRQASSWRPNSAAASPGEIAAMSAADGTRRVTPVRSALMLPSRNASGFARKDGDHRLLGGDVARRRGSEGPAPRACRPALPARRWSRSACCATGRRREGESRRNEGEERDDTAGSESGATRARTSARVKKRNERVQVSQAPRSTASPIAAVPTSRVPGEAMSRVRSPRSRTRDTARSTRSARSGRSSV